jgi:hypothetical protein
MTVPEKTPSSTRVLIAAALAAVFELGWIVVSAPHYIGLQSFPLDIAFGAFIAMTAMYFV